MNFGDRPNGIDIKTDAGPVPTRTHQELIRRIRGAVTDLRALEFNLGVAEQAHPGDAEVEAEAWKRLDLIGKRLSAP